VECQISRIWHKLCIWFCLLFVMFFVCFTFCQINNLFVGKPSIDVSPKIQKISTTIMKIVNTITCLNTWNYILPTNMRPLNLTLARLLWKMNAFMYYNVSKISIIFLLQLNCKIHPYSRRRKRSCRNYFENNRFQSL
jgi:hypothetical protein